ncbi:MAG TPA: hypothetical protein VFV35_07655 [Acidimicrobiales bacterium]|nr:hypothetical protein [Acidimicrobiales bacterium]
MRQFRRMGAAAATAAVLAAVIGGPASAQTETYAASAGGRVLNLKLGDYGLTAGAATASVDSTPKATAQGTGFLTPLGGQTTAALESTADAKNAPEECATPPLPAPLGDLLGIGLACAGASVGIDGGQPKAAASGKVAGIDADLSTITSQVPLEDVLGTILTPILGGLDPVEAVLTQALCTITGPLGGTCTPVEIGDGVQDLVDAVLTTKTLEIDLGTSTATTASDAAKVSSTAVTQGGSIKLFPLGAQLPLASGVELKPLVEIVVGSSTASATYDRTSRAAKGDVDPAIVTINLNVPIVSDVLATVGQITGFDLRTISVGPNVTPAQLSVLDPIVGLIVKACPDAPHEFCILGGTPLETRIAAASGSSVTNPDGSVKATANAVKIQALRNIADVGVPLPGGVLLELAAAEAAVGAQLPAPPAPAPEVPAAPQEPLRTQELPRTGGPAVLPVAAVGAVIMALAGRRALARSASR